MINPITFSIPKEKVVDSIPTKTKLLANIIPGKIETYIYDDEKDYYNDYKKSFFAITTKKAGWDCLRHYEIMANGCIPVFLNIEECPTNTLALFPKSLIIQGKELYEKLKTKEISSLTLPEINEYFELVSKILNYTKSNLTTCKIAQYILDKMHIGFNSNLKILFLSGDINPDYLRCLTLHGFKTLFGSACHDYPKIEHLYKNNHINYKGYYGRGMTYTNLLNNTLHDHSLDNNIEELIMNRYFNLVIYGSMHRGLPYIDNVISVYHQNEIIFLCGEDIHFCNCKTIKEAGYNVFVREL